MHVRCPHCHSPIEVVEDASLSDIPCPSCGSSFSLIKNDDTETYRPKQETIAHFTLNEKLGVGAFGTVWKRQDTELDRTVAIKVPRKGQLDADETEKFFREARAAAQLRHPNIVSVHEVGREGDTVYIVSDLVDGLTLSDWLTGQQVTVREAARLCCKIAAALEHAHEQGVIHRDLKPSNIILDSQGEPHIMDFGLAKREAGEVTMTMEGQVLGTPAYMSPEQAKGESHQGDRRSDVYSLGVILFELLTGELPFRGNMRMLLHQVIHEEPPSPRKLNGMVPRDLETVCLKCLEKEPRRRFQTAQELTDELQRFLERKPIVSRPITRIERGVRWCRRKPIVAGLVGTVGALLLFVATAGVLVSIQQAKLRKNAENAQATAETEAANALASARAEAEARVAAEAARVAAEEAESKSQLDNDRARIHAIAAGAAKDEVVISRDELRRNLYYADLGLAHQALIDADVARVDQLLNKYIPTGDETDLRGFEWFYLRHACRREELAIRRFDHAQFVRYAPDGETLAVAVRDQVELFDAETMLHRLTLSAPEQDQNIYRLAYSPDGQYLAIGLDGGRVCCWSLKDQALMWTHQLDGISGLNRVLGLAFSPDSHTLAAVGYGRDIVSVNADEGTIKRTITTDEGYIYAACFTQNDQLITSQAYGKIVCRNPMTGEVNWETPRIRDFWELAYSLDLSPDGTRIAAAYHRNSVRILDAANGAVISRVEDHGGTVHDVAYSPDGKYVASASLDWSIRIRDAETLAPLGKIAVGLYGQSVDFDPQRDYVAAAPLRRWRVADVLGDQVTTANQDGFLHLAISSNGKRFAAADLGEFTGHRVMVGSLEDPRQRKRLECNRIYGLLAFFDAEEGEQLLMLTPGGELYRISPDEDKVLAQIDTGHSTPSTVLVVNSGAKLAATAAQNEAIRVWNLDDLTLRQTLEATETAKVLQFNENGTELQGLFRDGSIRRWNVETGEARDVAISGGANTDTSGAFSDDGKLVACVRGNTILVCDSGTGEVLMTGEGHANRPQALCFLPNNQTVVSGGTDNTVRFWDIASGQVGLILRDHSSGIVALAVTPDGSTVLSAGRDRQLNIRRADLNPVVAQSVRSVMYSPDGSKIATLAVREATAGALYDCTVQIWDAESRQLLRTLDRDESSSGESSYPLLAFAPDSRHVAVAFDQEVELWDIDTGKPVRTMAGLGSRPDACLLEPDGKTLITAGRLEPLMFWDLATGERSDARGLIESARVSAMAIDAEHRLLACIDTDSTVHLIDLETRTLQKRVWPNMTSVTMAHFAGERRLLTGGASGVILIDLDSGDTIDIYTDPDIERGVRFKVTPHGDSVVYTVQGGTQVLLEIVGEEIQEIRRWCHVEGHRSVAISNDGTTVVNGTDNGQVILWNTIDSSGIGRLAVKNNLAHFQSLTTSKPATATSEARKPNYFTTERANPFENAEIFEMSRHARAMYVAFSPRDDWLLASAIGTDVRLWDTRTGTLLRTLAGHDYRIQSIAISLDGRVLASGGFDKRIKLWDIDTGQDTGELTTVSVPSDLAFLPDGKTLLCGQTRNPSQMWFWNMETRTTGKVVLTGGRGHLAFALSPNRNVIATRGFAKNPVQFWDMTTGQSRPLPEGIVFPDLAEKLIAFSRDGSHLAHTSNGIGRPTIALWSFAENSYVHRIQLRDQFRPRCIAFSPVGNYVALGSSTGQLRVYDVQRGEIRKTRPMRHLLRVQSLAFSQDGQTLASAGWEGIVKLWDPGTGELLRRLDQTQVSDDATEQPTDEDQAAENAAQSSVTNQSETATEDESGQRADAASLTSEEYR